MARNRSPQLVSVARLGGAFDQFLRRPSRWWWLLVFWAVLAGASYWWRLHELQNHAFEMASQRGRLVFEMVETTRLWAANHGGVYAPVSDATPPNPYLKVPEKVITTPSGKELTKINPAYMTRQLGELLVASSDLRIHLTSLKPINPSNAPDDWERVALDGFETVRSAKVSIVGAGGTAVFRYMAPLDVKKPCLACHEAQGYKLGDIRGGISVTFPSSYVLGIIDRHKRDYLVIHLIAFVLLGGISWLALTLIRRHVLALENAHTELLESEKMASLGRMVAGFAHELNTPVGVALGAASQTIELVDELKQLITQDEVSEEVWRQRIDLLDETTQLAVGNLKRAGRMVQSFKRTAVDQTSEAQRDYRLAEVIDDVLRNLSRELNAARIKATVNCAAELDLHGDVGVVEQVLTNLLTNAKQHAFADGDRPGSIAITARREQDQIVLEVTDDGAGMDAATVQKIFEPFFTTRRNSGGSGLGLFLVYSLVSRRLGGTIDVASQPGSGTHFVVRWAYIPAQGLR